MKTTAQTRFSIHTSQHSYEVIVEDNVLHRAAEEISLTGRAFIVTDSGIPQEYVSVLSEQYPDAHVSIIPQGESHKNMIFLESVLKEMLEENLSRNDFVIALGGGLVTDLAGLAASLYSRGIRYVNIPTTTLSQIDSSIGGKTAVNLGDYKNSIGTFHQPSMVLIDPVLLNTLPARHYSNGLVEAVKAGLLKDEELFRLFESGEISENIREIIIRSLMVKKQLVEADEFEHGVRTLLNFGHTLGHAFESYFGFDGLLHGECVGMGMMIMLRNEEIRNRLQNVLEKLTLPVHCSYDRDKIMAFIRKDKKADSEYINIVLVDEIGHGYLKKMTFDELEGYLEENG